MPGCSLFWLSRRPHGAITARMKNKPAGNRSKGLGSGLSIAKHAGKNTWYSVKEKHHHDNPNADRAVRYLRTIDGRVRAGNRCVTIAMS